MVTDNVYFNWKFLEKEEYCTNSPVVEKVFKESGDYLVSLNIINPGKSSFDFDCICRLRFSSPMWSTIIRNLLDNSSKLSFGEVNCLFYYRHKMQFATIYLPKLQFSIQLSPF